jgi:hypothetical protein
LFRKKRLFFANDLYICLTGATKGYTIALVIVVR